MSLKADFQKCFQEISDDREADLFVFNTDINITTSNNLIEQVGVNHRFGHSGRTACLLSKM